MYPCNPSRIEAGVYCDQTNDNASCAAGGNARNARTEGPKGLQVQTYANVNNVRKVILVA